MREFYFTLDKKELGGLRKFSHNLRNSGGFVSCFNVLPTEGRLMPFEPATDPFTSYELYDWPFPQFFVGSRRSCLMTRTKVFEISGSWALTEVIDFGLHPEWATVTWHVADFYGTIIGTNGYVVFWYNPDTAVWEQKVINDAFPLFNTLLNFNGQLVIGGVKGNWKGLDEQSIAWSGIGDVTLEPNQGNVIGNRPMPFTGNVFKLLPLGKGYMVYGYGGIGYVYPADIMLGFKHLASFGIMSRDAVAGSADEHVFIDENGSMFSINAELKLTELGYEEFFSPMVSNSPIIVYDDRNKEWHVSDTEKSFLLSADGLAEVYQRISSGCFTQGGFIGSSAFEGVEYAEDAYLITDTYDMRNRAQKTITAVELGGDYPNAIKVMVQFRNSTREAFRNSKEVFANQEGVAYVICSGVEFRFKVIFSDYQNINLDYITVRYKVTDKRAIRGAYNVAQDASGSSK